MEVQATDIDENKKQAWAAFLINNKDRIDQWQKAHKKNPKDLPVIYDERLRDFFWLNRKRRRG